jgi:hypothetical protein
MRWKSVIKRDVESETTATRTDRLSPADYPLGTLESRARARALVESFRLKNVIKPEEGDVFIQLDATPKDVSFYRKTAINPNHSSSKRVPGVPWFWFRFPEGFDPESVPEAEAPATMDHLSDEALRAIITIEKRKPADRHLTISAGKTDRSTQITSRRATQVEETNRLYSDWLARLPHEVSERR